MSIKAKALGLIGKATKPVLKAGRKIGYKVIKHGPTIAIVTGVGGLFAAGIMVGVKSRKAAKALEEFTEAREEIEKKMEDEARDAANEIIFKSPVAISEEVKKQIYDEQRKVVGKTYRKEVRSLYFRTGLKLARIYLVPAVLAAFSAVLIIGGHRSTLKRLAGVTALYKATDEAFRDYRKNVIDDLGEEADAKYRYGINEYEFEGIETDSKGKEKKITEKRAIAGSGAPFEFKFCRATSDAYTGDEEFDMSTLLISQNQRNTNVEAGKVVHVNDVLGDLAMKKIGAAGQINGWRDGLTDSVDYHIRKAYEPVTKDGVHLAENGKGRFETVYYLEFNAKLLYDVDEVEEALGKKRKDDKA